VPCGRGGTKGEAERALRIGTRRPRRRTTARRACPGRWSRPRWRLGRAVRERHRGRALCAVAGGAALGLGIARPRTRRRARASTRGRGPLGGGIGWPVDGCGRRAEDRRPGQIALERWSVRRLGLRPGRTDTERFHAMSCSVVRRGRFRVKESAAVQLLDAVGSLIQVKPSVMSDGRGGSNSETSGPYQLW